MAKAKTDARPATPGRPEQAPDKAELAARLFVKSYVPDGSYTAEHHAKRAIEAAKAFCEVYENHH